VIEIVHSRFALPVTTHGEFVFVKVDDGVGRFLVFQHGLEDTEVYSADGIAVVSALVRVTRKASNDDVSEFSYERQYLKSKQTRMNRGT